VLGALPTLSNPAPLSLDSRAPSGGDLSGGPWPGCPVVQHQRVDFAASMTDGPTVGELNPQSRSADEITHLWNAIATWLAMDGKES
jgi:hypothetical protein